MRSDIALSRVPIYRQLTDTLRAAIASGEYPVGSILPTELEISRTFGVSRYTVRDAMRILSSAGLIERRRHVGTIVIAQSESTSFEQQLPGFDELMQYGTEVRLDIGTYDGVFPCSLTRDLNLDGKTWLRIDGRRGPEDRLIGLAVVAIRRDCAPPKSSFEGLEISLHALVEKSRAIVVGRIDQEISAVAMEAPAARMLKSTAGTPALRARRLYYETGGKLFMATESIHPADRFRYKLSFSRNAPDTLPASPQLGRRLRRANIS
jgi:GntR family transcriptional regulator